jgi:hypothetical protein
MLLHIRELFEHDEVGSKERLDMFQHILHTQLPHRLIPALHPLLILSVISSINSSFTSLKFSSVSNILITFPSSSLNPSSDPNKNCAGWYCRPTSGAVVSSLGMRISSLTLEVPLLTSVVPLQPVAILDNPPSTSGHALNPYRLHKLV